MRIVSPTIVGTYRVLGATADTLLLQRDPTASVRRVPVAEIERLDVGHPRSTGSRIGRGLLIGAGVGAGAGVVLGAASGDDPDGAILGLSAGEKAVGLGALGALAGGIVGALVGGLGSGERWERVDLRRVALAAPPAGRGVGLRLAGAF